MKITVEQVVSEALELPPFSAGFHRRNDHKIKSWEVQPTFFPWNPTGGSPWHLLYLAGSNEFSGDQSGIVTTEAEGIIYDDVDTGFTCMVRNVIQVASRVRMVEVDGRRDFILL